MTRRLNEIFNPVEVFAAIWARASLVAGYTGLDLHSYQFTQHSEGGVQ